MAAKTGKDFKEVVKEKEKKEKDEHPEVLTEKIAAQCLCLLGR